MALTVAGYTLLPTAPPRFLGGAADGATELYGSAARPSGGGAVNALAAFPSGHVVFALIAVLPVLRWAPHVGVRAVAGAYPVLVAALVVVAGHHFWMDVLGAVLVVAIAAVVVAVAHIGEPTAAPPP